MVGTRGGLLLVVEGPEGAGKSTQVKRIAARLERAGRPHLELREPGGTPLGERIREIVLDAPGREISARAEAALFIASRAELVERTVRPALARGTVVTLDRFFLSTYAYQIHGRELPEGELRAANALATAGLVPDLTILLRLPATEGLRRADQRGARDRVEAAGDAFHRRVEEAFERFASEEWQRSHPECGAIVTVDAGGTEAEVERAVALVLAKRWPDIFAD